MKNKILTYSGGLEIEVNSLGVPVGYTKAGRNSPSGKTGHRPEGPNYKTKSVGSGREGFEIYAFPETKEYYEAYTA